VCCVLWWVRVRGGVEVRVRVRVRVRVMTYWCILCILC
jgi:hypothetical protein